MGARKSRQIEEASGDGPVDNIEVENASEATEDSPKAELADESKSEVAKIQDLDESQNEVEVDGPSDEEKLAEAEKKDNERCEKCLKPSWRGRHASICELCEAKGVIKPLDKEDKKELKSVE